MESQYYTVIKEKFEYEKKAKRNSSVRKPPYNHIQKIRKSNAKTFHIIYVCSDRT